MPITYKKTIKEVKIMADKNVQIRDMEGNNLFPKTLGTMVTNSNGENLGAVEAGAQVNKIESISLNGQAISIVDKAVNIELDKAAEYTIVKAATADEGYAATYQLAIDGEAFGEKINIPKDMVVQSGTVETCEEAGVPVAGLAVGDKYIDLVLANAENSHVYIPANDLVDVYTAADATIVIEGHAIKVNLTELAKSFQANLTTEQLAAANSGITAEKVADYDNHLANNDIHVTAELKATWSGKQDALTDVQLQAVNSGITAEKLATCLAKQDALNTDQLAAVNSGINADKVAAYDAYAATIAGKADQATTLAGYGITDGITFVEVGA